MGHALDRAIALLTEGLPVEWEGLLEDAGDDVERAQIEELRGLAQLDAEQAELPQPADRTIGLSAPGSVASRTRWSHLELVEEVGRGAFGTVYLAWDTRLAREVALKLYAVDHGDGDIEEARRLARVSHPNVVTIFGADRIAGQLGLWMELLRGRTLEAIIRDQGPFSAREAIAIGLDVCSAVAAIHAASLVHRDIKAQNVMREPGGRLVLMDLGASVDVTRDDVRVVGLAGTPLYMAPELFEGAHATVASDIYAVGVLLYRLVTSEFPVHAQTIGDVRQAHRTGALRSLRDIRPDLPAAYVRTVETCLASDPKHRYQSAAALERALYDIERKAAPRSRPRRTMLLAAAAIGGLILAAVSAMFGARLFRTPNDATPQLVGVSPEQYKVFAGYEELAFSKRLDDPTAAAAAVNGALAQIRPSFPGNQPIFGLLHAQLAEVWRRAGNLTKARADMLDGRVSMNNSAGDDHPYMALLAMESACQAQAAENHRTVAEQVERALAIRQRVLGLRDTSAPPASVLDAAALERHSRTVACDVDSDGDGLLDLVEVAHGLDPHNVDSDGDSVLDDDESYDARGISNRVALGLRASPFLNWAHYGAQEPRSLIWQAPLRFPMAERAERDPPGWSLNASNGQGYFEQRLSRDQSARAYGAGFSLLVRMQPSAGGGWATAGVNLGPVGPRFDVALRRLNDHAVETLIVSKIVPREGPLITVDSSVGSAGPLIEIRYRPERHAAELFADGRRLRDGYGGHNQFQDPLEGGVVWGVTAWGDNTHAAAAFQLVWLEIF
jgi:tRNA A-37 threonylcarbamoyl transferase component Bud32